MMDIHPEVSTGTVDSFGIPSQTTTEVTTSILVPNGETVFIGGLMKHSTNDNQQGVPVIGKVPVLKHLFSSQEHTNVNTETVVLITPRIVNQADSTVAPHKLAKVRKAEKQAGHSRTTMLEQAQKFDCVASRTNGLFQEVCTVEAE